MKYWAPFSFYFLYFGAFASLMPFFVLYYQSLGYTGTQIGLLTGIPPIITLVCAPLGASLADATHRHRLIIGLGLIVALAVSILLPLVYGFIMVFGLIIVFNIFMAPVAPLGDSATMAMLGEQKAMYGRVRMGGTFGWGIFALISGVLVDRFGLELAFRMFAGLMLVNVLISQQLTFGPVGASSSGNGGMLSLLRNRHWFIFLSNGFLGGVGTFTVAAFLYPYMAELGATETTMGVASMIATLTELPVFFFGHRLVKRFGARRLYMIALGLIGFRSLLYTFASAPGAVLFIQAFSGTVFPAMWVAGVAYAYEHAPAGLKSTAQGLFGAMTFGFGAAVGGFVGGLLLASLGGRGMFLVFGLIILVGLALIEGIRRILPVEIEPQPMQSE